MNWKTIRKVMKPPSLLRSRFSVEFARRRKIAGLSKKLLLLLCLSMAFPLSFLAPDGSGFPAVLETEGTPFRLKFQEWYDYVHSIYDTTNATLNHKNLTNNEWLYSSERWTLAYHPLFLTYAYEYTNDSQYLFEAKYFVDALYATTTPPDHTLVIYPRVPFYGLLDADAAMVWAMQRLNEFFNQNYDVTGYINQLKARARYNNSTDLAWGWRWNITTDTVTFDEELLTLPLLAYLDSKGVGEYTSDVQKIYNFLERYRTSDFYPYDETDGLARPDLTAVDMIYILAAYQYQPSLFNIANIQATLDAYGTTNSGILTEDQYVQLGGMAQLAVWKGFSLNQRLHTSRKQAFSNFHFNNTVVGLSLNEMRGNNAYGKNFLLALALSNPSSNPSYVYGGYQKANEAGVWNYRVNSTMTYNTTKTVTNYGIGATYQGKRIFDFWSRIGWDFHAFAYNSTYGYYQGYRAGSGRLTGQTLTMRVWENARTVAMIRNVYNTDAFYADNMVGFNMAAQEKVYIVSLNGSRYNATSLASTTIITASNPIFWHEPNLGKAIIYKVGDNGSAAAQWKIEAIGSWRVLTASSTYYEATPFQVPIGEATQINRELASILTSYADGGDPRNRSFSTINEGSIRYQLKHYTDISVQTNKNITSQTYMLGNLTINIDAAAEQTSIVTVYTSNKGEPANVTGASWSYNSTQKLLRLTVEPATSQTVVVSWSNIGQTILGDVNGDGFVDILDVSECSSHFYPGPPLGPLGYAANADLNNDGRVDILDLSIISANWEPS